MKLRGILDRSLSNQLCIRGFAPIKQLAAISEADYSYQRNLYEDQKGIVKDFLENESYLFFPEVILSYKFKFDGNPTTNPFNKVKDFQRQTSNITAKTTVEGCVIRVKRISYKGEDIRGSEAIYLAELELEEDYIDDIIHYGLTKPFHRIDGNHRLSVAKESDSTKVIDMVVPFCIILGEEYYNDSQLIRTEETELFDKSVRVYFHNINTKSLPLTSEQNLKVIIDDKKYFSDDDLLKIFDESGLLVRKTLDITGDNHRFTGLKFVFDKKGYRTVLFHLYLMLAKTDNIKKNIENEVYESLQTVNELYKEIYDLSKSEHAGILITFIFYKIVDPQKYFAFKNWILRNHLFDTDVNHLSLIEIFDRVYSQEFKVFVAMPFFDDDGEQVAEFNDVYNSTIQGIANDLKIKISLYPIMCNKGETQDQIQDIINKIRECSIFIADISDNNANVMYETGWARALGKPTLLFREKNSEKPKSDYANDTYHTYNEKYLNRSLSKITKENILEILSKNYGVVL